MSDHHVWMNTINDIVAIVDSARHSIPIDEMFEEEHMYQPIKESVSEFDIAAWLMFDTIENRETTTNLMYQFWGHIHKMRSVGPFLERIFDSYLGIYQVNYVSEKGIYIQNLIFKETADILVHMGGASILKEGDVFLGRIISAKSGKYLFHTPTIVSKDRRELFVAHVLDLISMQPFLEADPKGYKGSLKDGNPDILFLFSLALERATRLDGELYFYDDWQEDDDDEEDDDFYHREALEAIFGMTFDDEDYQPISMEDHYVMECLELEAMERENVLIGEGDFCGYEDLFESAAKRGEFGDAEQLLRIVDIISDLSKNNPSALKELEKVRENAMVLKRYLESSYEGVYRAQLFDQALKKDAFSHVPWITHFDEYVNLFRHYNMEATATGALNRDALELALPIIGEHARDAKRRIIEAYYPKLVLFREFALLKEIIVLDGNSYEPSARFDQYLTLSLEEKLSIWMTTLLNPKVKERAEIFEALDVEAFWKKFLDDDFTTSTIAMPRRLKREDKYKGLMLDMADEMCVFSIRSFGSSVRYHVEPTHFGQSIFAYMGANKRDNILCFLDRKGL